MKTNNEPELIDEGDDFSRKGAILLLAIVSVVYPLIGWALYSLLVNNL